MSTSHRVSMAHGEFRKLSIESISRSTVKAILNEHRMAPAHDRPHGSWFEFIRIHAATRVQCDFLSKPVWTPKGSSRSPCWRSSTSAPVDLALELHSSARRSLGQTTSGEVPGPRAGVEPIR